MGELSQLRLRCRRGMKELDKVLTKYLDENYEDTFSPEKEAFKSAFRQLLELEDPVLYSLIIGDTPPKNAIQEAVILKMRSHCQKH